MTATDTQPVDLPEDQWRGRFDEARDDDLPIDEILPSPKFPLVAGS